MGGLLGVLNVARDGINAHSTALDITSQNVAGSSTPGYVRRAPRFEAIASGGSRVAGVERSFDRFSFTQLADQQGRLEAARTRAGVLGDVEAVIAPGTATIADRIDTMIDAFHQLSLQPSDLAVRTAVLAQADWVASGFSETSRSLAGFRDELFSRAREVATEVSDRLEQVAELDLAIVSAEARGEPASDLRDHRDETVREVAQRIGGRVIEDEHGGITLFGAGTVLYQGGRPARIDVALDPSGSLIVSANRNGNVVDITRGIDSGTFGGLVEAREKDIPRTQKALDDYAFEVGSMLNGIHQGGYGLDGATARPLFDFGITPQGAARAMSLHPDMVEHPERLATASSAADLPGGNDVAVLLARAGDAALAGGDTMSERYSALATDAGSVRLSADEEVSMREDSVTTATTLRESMSGVSTDEEMIRLQQFQRGFEASMKVFSTVNELFDSLMRI